MVPILSMIRSYELDLDGKVSIVALVNCLQESALNHLKSVGLLVDGFDSTPEMHRRDLIWVAYLLEIEASESLNGIRIEMTDAAFPLLKGVVATTNIVEVCKDVNIAVMLGGYPQKKVTLRKDMLSTNVSIYKAQALALEEHATDAKTIQITSDNSRRDEHQQKNH
nr:malate dehydrogenase, cytoplasmic [Quercus suber]